MATILYFPQRKAPPVFPENDQTKKAVKRSPDREREIKKSMLAKVHIAKKELAARLPRFDDTAYRFILEVNFGVSSAAYLDNGQLHDLLLHLSKLGFTARPGRHRKQAPEALTDDLTGMGREGRLEKIEALLAEKGRVEGTDVPWGYAVTILKKQTKGEPDGPYKRFDDERVRPDQLDGVIAALCKDAKRRGRRVR